MTDFQGSELARPKDISDARNPKRRRLNESSSAEVLPHPHAVSSLDSQQHEYADDFVAKGEEDRHANCNPSCESDVEAVEASTGDDGWSECCYGMVGS